MWWRANEQRIAAIAQHRAKPDAHRLLPVLLDEDVGLPYGLAGVHAIRAFAVGGTRASRESYGRWWR